MDVLIFDLDNTLYPAEKQLFNLIDVRINRYMTEIVGIPAPDVDALRRDYWRLYGVTLQGLIRHHAVDPEDYLLYVHDIDVPSRLTPDTALREALEKLSTGAYDAILLDLKMPEMDGMETCEALRKLPETQNCLIVFLTARNEDSIQVAGLDAGADDYIAKPIKPKILVSRIHALLRRRGGIVGKGPIVRNNLTIDTDLYNAGIYLPLYWDDSCGDLLLALWRQDNKGSLVG